MYLTHTCPVGQEQASQLASCARGSLHGTGFPSMQAMFGPWLVQGGLQKPSTQPPEEQLTLGEQCAVQIRPDAVSAQMPSLHQSSYTQYSPKDRS
ncbi:MAG: hypothetical protein FWD57_08765 [Polyangiaceae bacterium]|nr:hypothetical protein [Polyangiaceae bacterium]